MSGVDLAHRVRLAEQPLRRCPALFVDRDGTLIEDPGYVADPRDVRLLAGVTDVLRKFHAAGHALILVTNQSGIARGLYGWSDYEAVAGRLRRLLGEEGIVLDAELACAHGAEDGAACGWRKPAPGMLLEAARLLDIDLSRSIMAGDKLSDLEAGAAAGVRRLIHVQTGQGLAERAKVRQWPGLPRVTELSGLSVLSPCAT